MGGGGPANATVEKWEEPSAPFPTRPPTPPRLRQRSAPPECVPADGLAGAQARGRSAPHSSFKSPKGGLRAAGRSGLAQLARKRKRRGAEVNTSEDRCKRDQGLGLLWSCHLAPHPSATNRSSNKEGSFSEGILLREGGARRGGARKEGPTFPRT